ncbi:SPOR domain-containing protein [Nitrincola sp. MINF-07-Sa-05]|uniref:SPOR domain-containing protein n=1 Tax=Nitrincola salilacus TaxID=3400273 RepID=UPI00391860EC
MTHFQRLIPLLLTLFISIASSHTQAQIDTYTNEPNPSQTEQDLLAAAEAGNLAAQLDLGALYYLAFDDSPRTQAAYDWWYKAALQGDARAQYLLALLYHQDAALGHDKLRAFAWLQLAAEQALPEALSIRSEMSRLLTPQQQREAQQLSRTLLAATEGEDDSVAVDAEHTSVEIVKQTYNDSAPSPGTGHYVQVAALMDEASANKAQVQWQQRYGHQLPEGITPFINLSTRNNGRNVYRLQLGPFNDIRLANVECERLKSQGQDCFVGRL